MGIRYYQFFGIMRQSLNNKQLEFTAPGNKLVEKSLRLFREKGLIAGFCLDVKTNWKGYPAYKVFLKYNYIGVPVIKKLDCFKLTRTSFTNLELTKTRLDNNNLWLVTNNRLGQVLFDSYKLAKKTGKLIIKIKI